MDMMRQDVDLREQLDLQEELNTSLRQGRKACLHLHGLIRKLKSVQAMLLMKKDMAKKGMNDYVTRLSECLLEFQSEMLVGVESILKEKFSEIAMLKEGYEEDIDTLNRLCEETEKMVQFDMCISTYRDKVDACKLLEAFSMMLPVQSEDCELKEVLKFEFIPAILAEELSASIFGHLDGSCAGVETGNATMSKLLEKKSTPESPVGQRQSRKDLIITERRPVDFRNRMVVQCTQATQTDEVYGRDNSQYPVTQQSLDTNNNHASAYKTGPQMKPNAEFVSYPCYSYNTYPSQIQPPGFPPKLSGRIPPDPGFLPNLSGGIPLDIQMPVGNIEKSGASVDLNIGQTYPGLQVSAGQVKLSSVTSMSSQCSPQSSSNTATSCSSKVESRKASVQTTSLESISEVQEVDAGTSQEQFDMWSPKKVKNIPLPHGPGPSSSLKLKEMDLLNVNNTANRMSQRTQRTVETVAGDITDKANTNIANLTIKVEVVARDKIENANIEAENKVANIANGKMGTTSQEPIKFKVKCVREQVSRKLMKSFNELEESSDDEVVEKGKVAAAVTNKVSDINETSVKSAGTQDLSHVKKAENLIGRMKEILKDGVLLRTDESTEFQKDKITPEKPAENKFMTDLKKVSPSVAVSNMNEEVSHTLSKYGQVLKDRIQGGKQVIVPLKPLRRPLRLPKISGYDSKSKCKHDASNILKEEIKTDANIQALEEIQKLSTSSDKESGLGLLPINVASIKQEVVELDDPISNKPETFLCKVEVKQEGIENIDRNPTPQTGNKVDIAQTQIVGHSMEKTWVPSQQSCKIDPDPKPDKQMTLREYVKMTHKPTSTERNREQLQSQTNWCKGFLSRRLNSDQNSSSQQKHWEVEKKNTNIYGMEKEKDSLAHTDEVENEVVEASGVDRKELKSEQEQEIEKVGSDENKRGKDDTVKLGETMEVSNAQEIVAIKIEHVTDKVTTAVLQDIVAKQNAEKPSEGSKEDTISNKDAKTNKEKAKDSSESSDSQILSTTTINDKWSTRDVKLDGRKSNDESGDGGIFEEKAKNDKISGNEGKVTKEKDTLEIGGSQKLSATTINDESSSSDLKVGERMTPDKSGVDGVVKAKKTDTISGSKEKINKENTTETLECGGSQKISNMSKATMNDKSSSRDLKIDEKKTKNESGVDGVVEETKNDKSIDKGGDTEKKTSLQNQTRSLKKCVENILGERKDEASCRSRTKLGSLQAHWLKNIAGTNIKAKLLFKFSSGLHFPIGVTTNSKNEIILTDTGNDVMKMWDQDGNFLKTFGIEPSMRRPSAVVVNEFDDIFVKDDICIRVFNKAGQYICDIAKDLFVKPFGLAMTSGKCLIVLDTNYRQPALVHVSQDGQRIWKFPYQPLINAPPGTKCRFMALSDNNVIVSDLGLSRIYITNCEGMFHRVIGKYGFGIGEFNEPSGISVDIYGNMVIGDSKNNRVQVYRHDGSYIGLMEFDEGIVRPSGIHLTADNKVIVVNFLHHCIGVYQL